ncbi:hypothetical protein BTVI_29531 [Pitangus sulphuratus]|nr:hypothetical protein BTVI_29531 [Pitangus sulphuratus]
MPEGRAIGRTGSAGTSYDIQQGQRPSPAPGMNLIPVTAERDEESGPRGPVGPNASQQQTLATLANSSRGCTKRCVAIQNGSVARRLTDPIIRPFLSTYYATSIMLLFPAWRPAVQERH